MSTSSIASAAAPRTSRDVQSAPELSTQNQAGKLDTPQFSQIMNLVQPKVAQEAVRAYEAHTEPRAKTKEVDADQVREPKEIKAQDEARHVSELDRASSAQKNEGVQGAADVAVDTGKRKKLLHLISQLSSEDLLSVAQWSGDLGLQAGALDTHLNLQNLPQVDGITTSDMMALLNGFKELKLDANQLPNLDGPQLAQWLESQWMAQKGQGAHRAITNAMPVAQDMLQQQNPGVNPAIMATMTAVTRSTEATPALEMLKVSQSQKEGILRQVAKGFKTQRNGTQSVNIRLHPEELGAVRLKVEVQGQDVRVFFSAENAVVTDLISQNLEELKAMLLEKDFNLTEAGLFQEQLAQGEQQSAEEDGEDYGSDERPDLRHRPKSGPKLSPLPNRFRATV